MKKYIISLIYLINFLVFPIIVNSAESLIVRVGFYENSPKIFINDDGTIKGPWADIIRHIATEENWQIKWVSGTWIQGLKSLKNGKINIMPDTGWTEPRSRQYAFSKETVMVSWSRLYVTKGSKINSIIDLDGKTIAALKGSFNLDGPEGIKEIIQKFNLKTTFQTMDSYGEIFKALEKGEVDAGVTNKDFGNEHENDYAVERTPIIFQPARIQFAFTKDADLTPSLIKIIDAHMKILKADKNSIYYQALDKYIGGKNEQTFIEIIPAWVKTVAMVCGGVILFLAAVGLTSRVQERRQAYELHKREDELKSIFRAAPIGIGVVCDRIIKQVNERFCEILGYSKNELTGKDARMLYPAVEDYEYVGREKYRQIEKHGTGTVETRFKHKNGKIIDILMSSTPLDPDNLSAGVTFTALDITERKLTDKALQSSHERFFTVLNSIDATIYVADMETYEIIFMNQNMIDSFEKDMTGELCWKAFREESGPCTMCKNVKLIDKDGNPSGVHTWQDKNPVTGKWYVNYDRAIEWTDGRLVKLQIATDITHIKKMESQLRQSQRMESIGTLAGGIAHDFNNILFPIVGYSEMLLEDIPEDSPFRNGLNQIYTSALRASELVKQILTFSRQKSGEVRLMKMQPIIKEALELIRSTIPATINIKQNIQSKCGAIKADPTQIHQIIMNLATNAYHAMEETGGELNIRLKKVEFEAADLFNPDIQPGTYACLSISDTGKGMDSELIKKIFDPFFTTKETGKGTGMGLSVVHGIVKKMNGAIQVYSEPDKGTEFHVYLPAAEAVKELQVISTKTSIQRGSEHIFLVDDEKAIIEMVQDMLEQLGYKVTSRTGSIEALEAFRANPDKFDLIITDMAMPNMSGDELSAEINKIRPGIPVLLCTGFSETMSEEKATSLGINGFMFKPIIMKDLSHKIREVLDEKQII